MDCLSRRPLTLMDVGQVGLLKTNRILRLRSSLPKDVHQVIRVVQRETLRIVIRYVGESQSEGFDWDFHQLPEGLDAEDLEVLAGCISAVSGVGVTEVTMMTDAIRDQIVQELTFVLDSGYARLSEQGQERLSPILDTLRDQLAALQYGTVDPYSISQFWGSQFDQYTDWEFARLARTEVAFAQQTVKLNALKLEYDAIDTALMEAGGLPPIHPNCLCDVQPMPVGEQIWLYLDTQMEPCEICNSVAEDVLNAILEQAA